MNDLQCCELNILKNFVEICDMLNLRYYLVCGSALGAVKYGGFIPWDDDIDVALPRPDYEVFLREAPSLLAKHYFLQNYRTDKYFHLIGSKIRDSNTTYIESWCEKLDINHGVFIDVFPLDGNYFVSQNQNKFTALQKKFEAKRIVRLNYKRFTSSEIFNLRKNLYYIMFKLFGVFGNTRKYMEQYEDIISYGDVYKSPVWCNYANSISKLEYAPCEQYGNGIWTTFEDIKVRIPEKYDDYLSQKYGDWRSDLPQEQRIGHHFYEVCDINRPYEEYIQHLRNGKIKIIKPK